MPAYSWNYRSPNNSFTEAIPVIKIEFDDVYDINLLELVKECSKEILEQKQQAVESMESSFIYTAFDKMGFGDEIELDFHLDETNTIAEITDNYNAIHEITSFDGREDLFLHKVLYRILDRERNNRIDLDRELFHNEVYNNLDDHIGDINSTLGLIELDHVHEPFDESYLIFIKLHWALESVESYVLDIIDAINKLEYMTAASVYQQAQLDEDVESDIFFSYSLRDITNMFADEIEAAIINFEMFTLTYDKENLTEFLTKLRNTTTTTDDELDWVNEAM